VRGSGEDKLCWKPARRRGFEVRCYYHNLISTEIIKNKKSTDEMTFPWKSIWRTKVPPRVDFFLWSAALAKILKINTCDRLVLYVQNKWGDC
jgi:hypothetical protein